MVDQSERAFRLLCGRHGVDLAYTPMIHAEPFASDAEFRRVYFDAWQAAREDEDRPLIAQLGGDDPHVMLQAAKFLEPHVDAVDINFGCPTEDARKGGRNSHSPNCRRFGAYLLPSLPLVKRLVRTLADGLSVPVTAKIRLLAGERATLDVACAIEAAGASALCVHARTVKQRPKYADRDTSGAGQAANWAAIKAVRQAVGIPVIANGGIETYEDALRCIDETGVAAVMSAEALLEDPDLFSEGRAARLADTATAVRGSLGLAREFLDLAEAYPSELTYPPTKSHLFKILHRLLGADQVEARKQYDAGLPLDLRQELKLELMRCPVQDFEAIRRALDVVEARYVAEPAAELGPSWYRRWRHLGPSGGGPGAREAAAAPQTSVRRKVEPRSPWRTPAERAAAQTPDRRKARR